VIHNRNAIAAVNDVFAQIDARATVDVTAMAIDTIKFK
tara:strand:+ start:296 stop:409 length:114 start_codon:yes stop_codon:yes gene_type:complete